MRVNESDASHVSCKVVDLLNTPSRPKTAIPASKVDKFELICTGLLVFGSLEVYGTNPETLSHESVHQVMADEPASPSHEYSHHLLDPSFNLRSSSVPTYQKNA